MQIVLVLPTNDRNCRRAARFCVRWLRDNLGGGGFSVLTSSATSPEGPSDELVWDGVVFGRWTDDEGRAHHDRSVMVLVDFDPAGALSAEADIREFLTEFLDNYQSVGWTQQALYVATQGSRQVDFITAESAGAWRLRG